MTNTTHLRALEPEDLEFLYAWENDTALWEVSDTMLPFSRYVLKCFIADSHRDIYETKQLRLMICKTLDNKPVGLADIYDFDPFHSRAGLGILIHDKAERCRGYAKDGLAQLIAYCFDTLALHQVYATVPVSNTASCRLFEGLGFQQTGLRKEWLRRKNGWEDTLLYQKIRL